MFNLSKYDIQFVRIGYSIGRKTFHSPPEKLVCRRWKLFLPARWFPLLCQRIWQIHLWTLNSVLGKYEMGRNWEKEDYEPRQKEGGAKWALYGTSCSLLLHAFSKLKHLTQKPFPANVTIHCWVIVITEICWATKTKAAADKMGKRRFVFISEFPPNPTRYLPPGEDVCSRWTQRRNNLRGSKILSHQSKFQTFLGFYWFSILMTDDFK